MSQDRCDLLVSHRLRLKQVRCLTRGFTPTAKHRAVLQQKLLDTSNPIPDQLSESAGVYDTEFSSLRCCCVSSLVPQ